MKNIWQWFDGNKMTIGTMILVITPIIFQPHTIGYQFLMWFGGVLTGVGVAHKVVKGTSNTGK